MLFEDFFNDPKVGQIWAVDSTRFNPEGWDKLSISGSIWTILEFTGLGYIYLVKDDTFEEYMGCKNGFSADYILNECCFSYLKNLEGVVFDNISEMMLTVENGPYSLTLKSSLTDLYSQIIHRNVNFLNEGEVLNYNAILKAVQSLTEKQKNIIINCFGIGCEKKSVRDIAKMIGISYSQTWKNYNKAIHILSQPYNIKPMTSENLKNIVLSDNDIFSKWLTTRIMYALHFRSSIRTLEQLVNTTDEQLLDIYGIGPKYLSQINILKEAYIAGTI